MVIQNSNVAMQSANRLSRYKAEAVSYSGWGNSVTSAEKISAKPTAKDSAQTEEINNSKETKETDRTNKKTGLYETLSSQSGINKLLETQNSADDSLMELTDENKVELESLDSLLGIFSKKVKLKKITAKQLFDQLFAQMKDRASMKFDLPLANTQGAQGGAVSSRAANMKVTQIEKTVEQTSFTSSGRVKTADGREIDFDMSFTKSSSFSKETSVEINYAEVYMMDPLVVNLSAETTEVSDQHFLFDLDCDGEEDNISYLAKNSAFLALDRNEDGVINDGSELFGAKTGDGFKELAVFDLDGNGWIDENDEIFNHLKIWKKNADGTDSLVALGVAGIGAIYLGNVATDSTLRAEDGSTLGAIRQTGIYLNEDGSAGTIQHVDLAIA